MRRANELVLLFGLGLVPSCLSLSGADDDDPSGDASVGSGGSVSGDAAWPDAGAAGLGMGGSVGGGGQSAGGTAAGGASGGAGGGGGTGAGGAVCQSSSDCDDFDVCTKDTCLGGQCSSVVIPNDDGNACTTDACNKVTGPSHVAVNCDDKNDCTVDTCEPASGCKHAQAKATTVCGSSCPSDRYVYAELCSASCSGECSTKGYNAVSCRVICGSSFSTCSAYCPSGYQKTGGACPVNCEVASCAWASQCTKI